MGFRLRSRRWMYATSGTGLAVLIAATTTMIAETTTMTNSSTSTGLTQLSRAPLGVNAAPWDYAYAANVSAHGGLDAIQPLLKAASIRQLRYGGGSYADFYDWQTNTNIAKCLPDYSTAKFTSDCASSDALSFTQFSRQARAVGASRFVTVNYGSGTPAEAAAWVAATKKTPGNDVTLWEVGNESYGCWEVNNQLAGPPEHYHGYRPSIPGTTRVGMADPSCPQVRDGDAAGMQTLATSYAVNAQRFLKAMKAADPSAIIGVPWAFGNAVPGASVPDSSEWNDSVLNKDGKYVGFVDVHYYPFYFYGSTGGHNPNDMQVLRSLMKIPRLYDSIRAELNIYATDASVLVGETAVSNSATTTSCTPEGAIFAAGDVLSWLAVGAKSVDWWYMNDYSNSRSACANPGSGLFSSSSPPIEETPYTGYLLASMLAQPRAMLGKMVTSDPSNVLAFQAALANGKHAMAFINVHTRAAERITFQPEIGLSGTLKTWTYGAANQNSENSRIITRAVPATTFARSVSLPADSIVIVETQ